MSNVLSYPEYASFLHELTGLQLHFAWRWAREHPGEPIRDILRNRVDLCRKTDPEPRHADIATLDFQRPAWLELEKALTAACEAARTADAFEARARACVGPVVEAFARKTYGSTAKQEEYQCGSLKYDAPLASAPATVAFHIGNAIAPASIFADPLYLPNCLRHLMDQAEERYGAQALVTTTWLNSLPKWLALFPDEWQTNLSAEDRNVQWHYGFWGQFISAKGTLNARYAQSLRDTGRFPFYPRTSHCSFKALRNHLRDTFFR